ncbi:hypothetical protein TTHERM_00279650 (macronuclear) [Tetrahymena thermophila SB210]|uniref:Uncharacterized protein n=1 Tax=Tetrahymena thermophila (strain SB210) TaxID=312017 RepID=I7M8D6_TETTS|nr:hypothetical protein TTHERM_00279650 [Tetrahymena thermophila SB210]EAR97880.2 hypothetical protein TTHERM_00279650 [Tetrahymena thermophila SB210]|eukprot:XP_001018125.2 hypothetical protein TTHERM_00279650 [Tetrahymena thermophila SB210]
MRIKVEESAFGLIRNSTTELLISQYQNKSQNSSVNYNYIWNIHLMASLHIENFIICGQLNNYSNPFPHLYYLNLQYASTFQRNTQPPFILDYIFTSFRFNFTIETIPCQNESENSILLANIQITNQLDISYKLSNTQKRLEPRVMLYGYNLENRLQEQIKKQIKNFLYSTKSGQPQVKEQDNSEYLSLSPPKLTIICSQITPNNPKI